MNAEWQKQTWSLDYLRNVALTFSGQSHVGAMALLHVAGVIPDNVKWKRKNRLPRFNINPDALPADYLAEVAYEWDIDGMYHPLEFVEGLEYEVAGRHRNAISRTLSSLGKSAEEFVYGDERRVSSPADNRGWDN